MQSQFICPHEGTLLGHLSFSFPEGTHAIGRLDKNSEGLLLLTTNKKITKLLFQSKVPHKRTYLVQVKHKMNEETLSNLRNGVRIRIKGGDYYTTPPNPIDIVQPPPDLFPAPVQKSLYLETTWLSITLTEGRYHQVRKMVEAAHHRCIRLIRVSIEDMLLGDLQPGQVKEVDEETFFQKLHLTPFPLSQKSVEGLLTQAIPHR